MIDLWILLFGHILGDYFFQTHEMATKKVISDKWAAIHAFIYTMCVVVVLGLILNPLAWSIVFVTHYPIDRYGIAKHFMEFKGGSDFSNPFAPIIYVIIDNTMHMVLMIALLRWMI